MKSYSHHDGTLHYLDLDHGQEQGWSDKPATPEQAQFVIDDLTRAECAGYLAEEMRPEITILLEARITELQETAP